MLNFFTKHVTAQFSMKHVTCSILTSERILQTPYLLAGIILVGQKYTKHTKHGLFLCRKGECRFVFIRTSFSI